MSRKRRKKSKNKISPQLLCIISIVIIIGVIIIIKNNINKSKTNVNQNNKAITSHYVVNKSYDEKNKLKTIEIKTNIGELNSVIVTNTMLQEINSSSGDYAKTLKEVMESNKLSNRDLYNIKKAIELKYVDENTKLSEYYWKVTGFKSLEEFKSFCEENF